MPDDGVVRFLRRARPLSLTPVSTLEPPGRFDQLVEVSVGPHGDCIALWTDEAGLHAVTYDEEVDGSDLEGHWSRRASMAVVSHSRSGECREVTEVEFGGNDPMVQPLGADRLLLGSRWAVDGRDGPEQNAAVLGPDGIAVRTTCLGTGINQVLATEHGDFWVAFSDVGVFDRVGEGKHGLVRFDAELEVAWRFEGNRDFEIVDCEAITLSGDDLWAYNEPDFDLVRVRDNEVRRWRAPTKAEVWGVQALATDAQTVLMAGGWSEKDCDRRVVAELGDDDWRVVEKRCLTLANGAPLPAEVPMVGRDGALHVFVGRDWHTVSVADLV